METQPIKCPALTVSPHAPHVPSPDASRLAHNPKTRLDGTDANNNRG